MIHKFRVLKITYKTETLHHDKLMIVQWYKIRMTQIHDSYLEYGTYYIPRMFASIAALCGLPICLLRPSASIVHNSLCIVCHGAPGKYKHDDGDDGDHK